MFETRHTEAGLEIDFVSADLAICPRILSEGKIPRRKQARHTSVKDIRSILRLTFEQELPVRAVKTSVSTYLLRAREALRSPGLDDDEIVEQRLFRRMGRPPHGADEPAWPKMASELSARE